MVPTWSLALAFAAGLAVGVVACRLVLGRARPAEPVAPAAVTGPEPVEPVAAGPVASDPEPEPEPEPEPVPGAEDPAAAVDDVVAELERRVKGRRTDGEAERPSGRRGGRRG